MMHDITTIINWLHYHKTAVASIVGGSAGLSVVLEVVFHKLHINSKKLAVTILHVTALITAGLTTWIAGLKGFAPAGLFSALVIVSQLWHRFAVSPLYNSYIIPFLKYLSTQKKSTVSTAPTEPTTPFAGQ
jgi:hypothetical protein